MSLSDSAQAGTDRDRGTATTPSPGLDPAAVHPVLDRMLHDQNRLRRLDRRRPWLLDTAVVLFAAALSVPVLVTGQAPGPRDHMTDPTSLPLVAQLFFAAAFVVPLWWRRRAPAATIFVIARFALAQWSLGVQMQEGASLAIALYSLALRGSIRTVAWAAGLLTVQLTVAVYFLLPVDNNPVVVLALVVGNAIAAIALGLAIRTRRLYTAALEDRAERLEIERDQRVRLTAAAERSRVAREMHDIVGHNLSVMVGLADGAATLATGKNDDSAEALRLIGDTGRQAMGELRRVLGVLRERPEGADRMQLSPQPGIGELDALLARVRAAGLAVTYRTTGDPEALGDGVQLTVYRIVQEALTNTLKHAGTGARAEVDVTVADGRVRVRVVDTGTGGRRPVAGESGHGLVGIRQRAAMYHGSVTIGPRGTDTEGGWIVNVLLDAPPAATGPSHGEQAS
jgi:signal transduction histidine kinase